MVLWHHRPGAESSAGKRGPVRTSGLNCLTVRLPQCRWSCLFVVTLGAIGSKRNALEGALLNGNKCTCIFYSFNSRPKDTVRSIKNKNVCSS